MTVSSMMYTNIHQRSSYSFQLNLALLLLHYIQNPFIQLDAPSVMYSWLYIGLTGLLFVFSIMYMQLDHCVKNSLQNHFNVLTSLLKSNCIEIFALRKFVIFGFPYQKKRLSICLGGDKFLQLEVSISMQKSMYQECLLYSRYYR